MNQRRWIATGAFTLLLVLSIVINMNQDRDDTQAIGADWTEEVYEQGALFGDKLVIIEIEGAMIDTAPSPFIEEVYNHQRILQQLETAFEAEDVQGIILRINTPGGGVIESDELYRKIMELKEEHDKPIVASMTGSATSGGYYVAAPTDLIYANRSTITGSIGVIIGTWNYAELADELGIKQENFTSGPYKDILSPTREVTDEERAIIQSIVDESYDQFIDAIVDGRGMDRSQVLEAADGRIYSGQQAKDIGLVDEVGFLDDAINALAELADSENPTVVTYKTTGWLPFGDVIPSLSFPSQNLFNADVKDMLTPQSPNLMYIYQP